MAIDHNPTWVVSTFGYCNWWGLVWGAVSSLVAWGAGAMPLEALATSLISAFQIAFPCTIRWPNLFQFYVSFCLCDTCMVTLPPQHHVLNGNTKWQVMWPYHKFCSKPHVHAFSCQHPNTAEVKLIKS